MNYKVLLLASLTILVFILSSCATIWDVQGLQNQIDTIKASITDLNSLKTSVFQTEKKLSNIYPNIENLQSNYAYIKNTVDSLVKSTYSIDSLNNKISKLQEELDLTKTQNDKNYTYLKSQYAQLNSNVVYNQFQLKDALDSISNIKNTQDTFSKALSTIDKTILQFNNSESKIENIYSRIDNLDSEVGNIENSIDNFSTTSLSSSTIKTSDFIMLSAKVDAIKNKLSILNSIEDRINELTQKQSTLEANISRMQINKNSLNIPYTYIIVQKGDTLYKIAKAYNTSISDIEKLNNKSNANIYGDELLKLPLKNDFTFPFSGKIKVNIPYGSFIDHSLSSWVEFNYSGEVVSILPGRIDEIGNNRVFGKYIRLYCGNYIYITYGNLQSVYVNVGDWVNEGVSLGASNNFILSVSINGDIKDPLKILALSKDIGTVTYYTEWDDGKNPTYPSFRITRMGTLAKDWQTIAADLTKMPLGTIVYIPYFNDMPNKGIFRVEDSGSAVNGNDIDIFISDIQKALKFKKNLEVYAIRKP